MLTARTILDLLEGNGRNVIVVDIQPKYWEWIKDAIDVKAFINFLNQSNKILLIYVDPGAEQNAEGDEQDEVIDFYLNLGLSKEKLRDITFVGKGIRFFAPWFDGGASEYRERKGIVQKVARYMVMNRIDDSGDIEHDHLKQETGIEWQSWMDWDYIFISPDVTPGLLKRFQGAYLCGGGENQCLADIEVLLGAFNVSVKRLKEFIYQ